MFLSETKWLLRKRGINPNRFLGQNFLVDSSFFHKMENYAKLSKDDVVLDVGAGFGFLTRYLSGRCKRVIAVEKDPRIVGVLRTQLKNLTNVTIISGDVLNASFSDFDKVVSIPPYYLSSSLLVWLFNRNFECGVLILQKEFGDRLVAPIGTENYGWLTVFAYFNAEITLLDPVPRSAFFPQPTVNSVIVLLKPRKESQFELRDSSIFKQMVRSLFAQRNKKVVNALIPFLKNTLHRSSEETEQIAQVIPFLDQRVRTLPPENFGVLANAIIT